MKKRVIAFFTAVAVACTSTTAYAHNSDVFGGSYIGRTKADFVLRVHVVDGGGSAPFSNNALTNLLTYEDVYMYGMKWNGISSNVNLSVITAGGSTPTIKNELYVFGGAPADGDKIILGQVLSYGKDGKRCDINDDWSYATIEMNTSNVAITNYYVEFGNKDKAAARKVFMHEVGHALKLAHPVQSATHSGNNSYDGYPYAIMNDGSLDKEPCAADEITEHDKSCLIAKWGK